MPRSAAANIMIAVAWAEESYISRVAVSRVLGLPGYQGDRCRGSGYMTCAPPHLCELG